MRVLAVSNRKGGVGKTTTAVNVAAFLVRRRFRVLVVDADSQANATLLGGVHEGGEAHGSARGAGLDELLRQAKDYTICEAQP